LPDGKKVSLNEAGDTGAEAAPFQAPKPEGNKPETKTPPPEIELPVPPG
jgi:hypothetical protein